MTQLTDDLREASKQVTFLIARDLMQRAADELEKIEREADKLAHEAAREAARADKAEREPPAVEVSDFLNMP